MHHMPLESWTELLCDIFRLIPKQEKRARLAPLCSEKLISSHKIPFFGPLARISSSLYTQGVTEGLTINITCSIIDAGSFAAIRYLSWQRECSKVWKSFWTCECYNACVFSAFFASLFLWKLSVAVSPPKHGKGNSIHTVEAHVQLLHDIYYLTQRECTLRYTMMAPRHLRWHI